MKGNYESNENYYSLEYLNSQIQSEYMSDDEIQRTKNILDVLNSDIIDLEKLREYSNQGIPDECFGLRALVWKILFGYLKPDRSTWV